MFCNSFRKAEKRRRLSVHQLENMATTPTLSEGTATTDVAWWQNELLVQAGVVTGILLLIGVAVIWRRTGNARALQRCQSEAEALQKHPRGFTAAECALGHASEPTGDRQKNRGAKADA